MLHSLRWPDQKFCLRETIKISPQIFVRSPDQKLFCDKSTMIWYVYHIVWAHSRLHVPASNARDSHLLLACFG